MLHKKLEEVFMSVQDKNLSKRYYLYQVPMTFTIFISKLWIHVKEISTITKNTWKGFMKKNRTYSFKTPKLRLLIIQDLSRSCLKK